MSRSLTLTVVAALLAACGPNSGGFSQARFGTGCQEGSTCVSGIHAPLAVGGVLPLVVQLDLPGSTAPPLRLEAVTEDVFRVEEFSLVGLKPGLAALLVIGPEETVIDFIHLWVEQPDRLDLARRNGDGVVIGKLGQRLTLLVGDEILFSVQPISGSQHLVGEFAVEWEGGADVVRVLPAGIDGWQRLVARAPGTVSLVGSTLGLTRSLEVEVLE
jgi:hypothetical protein